MVQKPCSLRTLRWAPGSLTLRLSVVEIICSYHKYFHKFKFLIVMDFILFININKRHKEKLDKYAHFVTDMQCDHWCRYTDFTDKYG